MACKTIRPNISKVCIADLRNKIKVQFSSSKANNSPNSNAGTSFKNILEVWALIKTNPASEFINGINVVNGVNTDFYIRYTSSIDFSKQIWVEFENSRFKIAEVENIDRRNEFVRLRAIERGNKSLGAAQR